MTELPRRGKIESSRSVATFTEPLMITDEELMAYADGALPPVRRAAVRAALANDAALMERLESFLFTRGPFADAFEEVLEARVPDKLLAPFREAAKLSAPRASRRLFGILPRGKGSSKPAGPRAPALLVASIAGLAVGASLVWFAVPRFGPYQFVVADHHGLILVPAVQQVLEKGASHHSVDISERLTMKPLATLPTQRGVWCRVAEIAYRQGPTGLMLACRQPEGAWHLPDTKPANPIYALAGPEEVDKRLLEALQESLGRPVTSAREKSLRDNKWSEKP